MTECQIELGRHALGLPNPRKTSYRNHFCAGVSHSDYPHWMAMVKDGNATHRSGNQLSGGDDIFWLTKAGAMLCLMGREKLDDEDFPSGEARNGEE